MSEKNINEGNAEQVTWQWFQEYVQSSKYWHSLCTTGATQLFQAQVPEKMNKQRTGQRSLEALSIYEHVTAEEEKMFWMHHPVVHILKTASSNELWTYVLVYTTRRKINQFMKMTQK